MLAFISFVGFAASGWAAQEAPVVNCGADSRQGLQVTVYSNGSALVREARGVTLPEGAVNIRWSELPQTLDPASVIINFTGSSGAVETYEQTYEYNVVDSNQLLESYLEKKWSLWSAIR